MKKIFLSVVIFISISSFGQEKYFDHQRIDSLYGKFSSGASTDSVVTVNANGKFFKRNASAFGISGITADNGLTASTSTNVQLGGMLLANTTIATGSNKLTISTSTSGVNPLYVSSNDDYAIRGVSTSAIAISGQSTNDFGISAYSGSVAAIVGTTQPSSTNTVVQGMRITRASTGTVADGVGVSYDFNVSTIGGGDNSNQLISKWTNATHATRTSQFIITGVSSATTNNLLTLDGDGTATFIGNVHLNNSGSLYIQSTNSYSTGGWGNVVWNVNTGRAEVTNGSILAMNSTAIDVTLTVGQYTMLVTATGKTVTLPTAVGVTGTVYVVKLTAAGSATVTTTSSQTIDGSTTYSLASQYKYVTVQSDGSNWVVIGNN